MPAGLADILPDRAGCHAVLAGNSCLGHARSAVGNHAPDGGWAEGVDEGEVAAGWGTVLLLLWCLVELSEGLVELRQEVGISGVGSEGHVRRRLLESSGQHRGFVACWRGGVSRFVLWGPVGRPRRRGRCSVACAETWGTSLCIRSWGLDDRARGALSSTSGGVNRVVLVSRDLGWVSARSPGLDTLASLRGSTSGGGEGSGVCGRDPGVGSQRMVTGSRRSGAGRPQLDQRRGKG